MRPSYLSLYHNKQIFDKASILKSRLTSCNLCPRKCGINRLNNELGFCKSGYLPLLSSYCDHHGEEPVISGTKGTGAIFFSNCNMRCLYCQNHQISQPERKQYSKETTIQNLADIMLYLQNNLGCHSINLVSPTHYAAQIVEALIEAIPRGFTLPLIYNTNGYDSVETLQVLDGLIDVYLPDVKYSSDVNAEKYSCTPNYVQFMRNAVLEMYRQVGEEISIDENGVIQRGLIIRHLVLPNDIAGSRNTLKWIAESLSPNVTLSVMSQYFPAFKAPYTTEINRNITVDEYKAITLLLEEFGMENGWIQEMDSAQNYRPNFENLIHPFE